MGLQNFDIGKQHRSQNRLLTIIVGSGTIYWSVLDPEPTNGIPEGVPLKQNYGFEPPEPNRDPVPAEPESLVSGF